MKKILTLLALLLSVFGSAQIQNPITWTYSQKQLSDSTTELLFTATLEDGWHLYSQKTPD
jgi:thiol:disulfide interchange protein DsbD